MAIGGFIFLFIALYGAFFVEYPEIEENKRFDWIMNIYPPLIEDLNKSMERCNDHFKNRYGFIDNEFKLLRKHFSDGTIKAIEGFDKELYNNLVRIKEEIVPLLTKIEDSRRNTIKMVEARWYLYLDELEGNEIYTPELVQRLISSIIWDIWRDRIHDAKKGYDQIMNSERRTVITFNPPPSTTFDEFVKIAKGIFSEIKESYVEIEQMFEEIITNAVIPRMENTIKKQFE